MASSDEVLATIPVDMEPRWVAVTPDGHRAYVTLTKDQPGDLPTLSAVAVIDTQTNTVAATVTIDHRSNWTQRRGDHTRWSPGLCVQLRRAGCGGRDRHRHQHRH